MKLKRPQRRPRYADVAATLALVISMGGTSYAAAMITSANIKDGTILSRDVADGAGVRGVDVKDSSLGLADIDDSAEALLRGNTGPQGQQGEPGTALGYAYVIDETNVPVDWRRGMTEDNVTLVEGVPDYRTYCFHDLPFSVDNIQVTPQVGAARVSRGAAGCPSTTQAVVAVGTEGAAFWVLFN